MILLGGGVGVVVRSAPNRGVATVVSRGVRERPCGGFKNLGSTAEVELCPPKTVRAGVSHSGINHKEKNWGKRTVRRQLLVGG